MPTFLQREIIEEVTTINTSSASTAIRAQHVTLVQQLRERFVLPYVSYAVTDSAVPQTEALAVSRETSSSTSNVTAVVTEDQQAVSIATQWLEKEIKQTEEAQKRAATAETQHSKQGGWVAFAYKTLKDVRHNTLGSNTEQYVKNLRNAKERIKVLHDKFAAYQLRDVDLLQSTPARELEVLAAKYEMRNELRSEEASQAGSSALATVRSATRYTGGLESEKQVLRATQAAMQCLLALIEQAGKPLSEKVLSLQQSWPENTIEQKYPYLYAAKEEESLRDAVNKMITVFLNAALYAEKTTNSKAGRLVFELESAKEAVEALAQQERGELFAQEVDDKKSFFKEKLNHLTEKRLTKAQEQFSEEDKQADLNLSQTFFAEQTASSETDRQCYENCREHLQQKISFYAEDEKMTQFFSNLQSEIEELQQFCAAECLLDREAKKAKEDAVVLLLSAKVNYQLAARHDAKFDFHYQWQVFTKPKVTDKKVVISEELSAQLQKLDDLLSPHQTEKSVLSMQMQLAILKGFSYQVGQLNKTVVTALSGETYLQKFIQYAIEQSEARINAAIHDQAKLKY